MVAGKSLRILLMRKRRDLCGPTMVSSAYGSMRCPTPEDGEMTTLFIPEEFVVPESLVTEQYRLEMLSPRVTEIDYDAVMSSRIRLRSVFREKTKWPRDDMSLEENRRDLERHELEFRSRQAFAYTVLTPSRQRCIGCVYIVPTAAAAFDCAVYLWVKDSAYALDHELYTDVRHWLMRSWPFKNVAFPGRKISWDEWKRYLSEEE